MIFLLVVPAMLAVLALADEPAAKPTSPHTDPNIKISTLNALGDSLVKCNSEMMTIYGLRGYPNAVINTSKYCPKVTQNCCSPEDEETSMNLWKFDYRYKIERYYDIYVYALKYLLGYTNEAYRLGLEFEDSQVAECRAAAADMMAMNFNPKITMDVYNVFHNALMDMADLRKGFFCILCDARTQDKLKDFWASTNFFNRDRIYFSKEFCKKLVDDQIQASFYQTFYTKRYLDNLGTLVSCKVGNTTKLEYEVPVALTQQIKNCYYFKNKYFFYFCEKYCEKFHLTKASEVFDGNLVELRKFVDHLILYRKSAFTWPNNNILIDGIRYEESYLKDFYENVLKDMVFIRPQMQQVMLDKIKTDVVYWGGMDPYDSIDGSLYPFIYGASPILAITTFLTLLLMW